MEQVNNSLYKIINDHFGDQVQPQLQRKTTLITLSHAIEDEVLHNGLAPVIFAAFQNSRFYQKEHPRYEQLRQLARAVTLYGQELSDEARYDRDWFVVINEPRFKVLVASYELEPKLEKSDEVASVTDIYRPFLGLWSYDREIVDFASRYLAASAPPAVAAAVEEIIVQPHQALDQVRYVSNVSDRILSKMEHTNRHALHQINHNHQLLLDLDHQAELLQKVDLAKQMAENERNSLHQELGRLYQELTRSQTVLTQAVVDKARLEQNLEISRAILQQLIERLKTGQTEPPLELLEKIQLLLGQARQ